VTKRLPGAARAACASGLCAALLLAGATTAQAGRAERKAERVVHRLLKKRHLPDQRRVRCGRHRRRGAVCRWRAQRSLSPNRARRCRGRYRVRLRHRRARVRRLVRTRCKLRLAAVQPKLGVQDISIGSGRASAEEVARLAEGLGAGLLRMPFGWRYAERQRGVYDMRIYDRLYRALLARGIRPLILLSTSPRWAWPPLTFCSTRCSVPPARRYDADWERIAAELARRYPRAAAIEIWNEANEATFWQPRADPARYTELLKKAYAAIKRVRPSMPVVGGSIDGRQVTARGSMAGTSFLREVLAGDGGRYMDAVGIHPYVPFHRLDFVRPLVASIRAVRDDFGHERLPLWVSEIGLTTTGARGLSEKEQATGLVRLYRTLRAQKDIHAVIFHALVEPGDDGADSEAGYGIVRGDLTPKAAYCALRTAAGVAGACPR
jgi:hypothetical protein